MNPKHIMVIAILAILLIMVTACSSPVLPQSIIDTVDVSVPTLQRDEAPIELKRTPIDTSDLPEFVAPTNPAATSCLTGNSEPKMKGVILRDQKYLNAWEKWAFQ